MAVVTQTDRPKSVRNHCVIKVFVLSIGREFSVGIGAFVIGLSQISYFSSCYISLQISFSYVEELKSHFLALTRE